MKNNPFCLSFGKEPERYVERADAYDTIMDNIYSESETAAINSFLVMGLRGSGKTVLLATIANELRKNDSWIVVTLNPGRDLLQMFAAGLYEDAKLQRFFLDASLNLSKFGIGLNIDKKPPISDIQIAIERMVRIVKDHGKRILITIDDVTKSESLISFASAYQDLVMKNYPVFMLMTGLYENVYSIQTDKRCSFLMRAEKIILKPLNRIGMMNQYMQTFQISSEEALKMAALTLGYSYAFQALGHIMWDKECSLEEAVPIFDEKMSEYCYEKIWEDLSPVEKQIVTVIAENGEIKTAQLLSALQDMSKSTFSVYRDRLIKKGIIDGSKHGIVSLNLPRFKIFIASMNY